VGGEKNSSSDKNEIEALLVVEMEEGSHSEPCFNYGCEVSDLKVESDSSGRVVGTPAGLLVSLISSLLEISLLDAEVRHFEAMIVAVARCC
jgi:hypothetical protein